VIAASRYGKVDGGWDLRRYAVIRECADQAYGRVRRACRDDGEVGMLSFVGFGQTVKTAAEFYESSAITKGIERVGVHPKCDEVASAERTALIAESLECGVEMSGLHLG